MTILQLNPPLPVTCPKGAGQALFLIDYGAEHHLMWTIAIDDSGELWTFQNPFVRAQKNITMGRLIKKEITTNENESEKAKGATLEEFKQRLEGMLKINNERIDRYEVIFSKKLIELNDSVNNALLSFHRIQDELKKALYKTKRVQKKLENAKKNEIKKV